MILPNKHVNFSQSLIGLAAFLISMVEKNKDIDELWDNFQRTSNSNKFPTRHSFSNFLLCLDFMFMVGLIFVNEKGEIHICV